jgi:hypothetical protein
MLFEEGRLPPRAWIRLPPRAWMMEVGVALLRSCVWGVCMVVVLVGVGGLPLPKIEKF